jgi:hypothetical protein
VINQPSGNPAAGNVHGQPNNPSNTYGRSPQPGSPANANPNGVRSGEPVNAPATNIARPPQAGGNGNTPGNGNQVNPQRTPVWTNENIGRTPANPNQGGQKPAEKAAVPTRPASPPAAPHAMVPAQRPHNPPPPARTAEPAPQHKNAPPPKENKDKEKDKDKEPRGH